MRSGVPVYNSASALLLATASWPSLCAAVPSTGVWSRRSLVLDFDPAPPPDEGPELSAGALRDPSYLPAQIGGIVGAYGFSLVLVAFLLLALAKTRREHLENRDLPENESTFVSFNPFPQPFLLQSEEEYKKHLQQFQTQTLTVQTNFPQSPVRNFSLPSGSPLSPTRSGPLSPSRSQHSLYTTHSPSSTILPPGSDLIFNPTVQRDRAMAQEQLAEMYKYVMAHEEAKAEGREYTGPDLTSPSSKSVASSKRERNKPSNLNLASSDEKALSRGSSILSFLKSPRKKPASAMQISSPIMTPMSGTFPRRDEQELNAIPPRHYAPAAPPPIPSDLGSRRPTFATASSAGNQLPSPDVSPVSTQSIDSRIDAPVSHAPAREARAAARREQREREGRGDNGRFHSRDVSAATSASGEPDPVSAVSEKSTSGLVGLPTSPKPGVDRFPSLDSLPTSPRPGQTFAKSAPPQSAIRQGGALPLRAYESSLTSPTSSSFNTTKQTVFTRAEGPLSPGLRTPWTGAPVPYTPYQPFSPVMPITPSVVTKADRKRMKKLEPKTPTLEMVKATEEIW